MPWLNPDAILYQRDLLKRFKALMTTQDCKINVNLFLGEEERRLDMADDLHFDNSVDALVLRYEALLEHKDFWPQAEAFLARQACIRQQANDALSGYGNVVLLRRAVSMPSL